MTGPGAGAKIQQQGLPVVPGEVERQRCRGGRAGVEEDERGLPLRRCGAAVCQMRARGTGSNAATDEKVHLPTCRQRAGLHGGNRPG